MATTQVKSFNSDNQAVVDSTGHLYVTDGGQPLNVTGNITTSNPSVGTTGVTAPASATEVGGINPTGLLEGLKVDSSGALLVNTTGSFGVQNVIVGFNNASSVAVGTETTINTYTAVSTITYLLSVGVSGGNRAQYRVYVNGVLFDTLYSPVTTLSGLFDYKTGVNSVPGFVVPIGQTVTITVINNGTDITDFNSRFLILGVT